MDFKIDQIVHSSLPRAIETARIIQKKLNFRKPMRSCGLLNECVPGFPSELRKRFGHTDKKKLKQNEAQMLHAYRKHFRPTRRDSVEVLVCHGNVIRYLICKVLDVDTLAWRKIEILQCSVSVVKIRSKGANRRIVITVNDAGHIPIKFRTLL